MTRSTLPLMLRGWNAPLSSSATMAMKNASSRLPVTHFSITLNSVSAALPIPMTASLLRPDNALN